jgi:AcrR family transcriptional regulator
LSKSGLFVHFGSKASLEAAVVERAGELFDNHVLVPAKEDRLEGIEQVWTLCDLWLKFVERHVLPGNYFFSGALFHCGGRDGPIADRITAVVWRWLKALKVAIEKAKSLGEFDDGVDTKRTAMELNGLLISAQWCCVMEDEIARRSARLSWRSWPAWQLRRSPRVHLRR